MVQCAALVESIHGIVNLIMNLFVCYGKGHTIHSSGQIEWFQNSEDDRSRSVQLGGKQRICTIDGYAIQLKEFRQPIQVQILLEMSGILVQLGRIQRT